jgi:rhodanese-related sulfurtransferase
MQGAKTANRSRGARRVFDALLLVLAVLAVWRLLAPPERPADAGNTIPPLQPGQVLALSGIAWDSADAHVVLLLDSTCPACNAGAPFYRRLSADVAASLGKVRLFVISRQAPDVIGPWLDREQIRPDRVLQVDGMARLGLYYSPSLVVVDRAGRVTDILVRGLDPTQEALVRSRVTGDGLPQALNNNKNFRSISSAELPAAVQRGATVVDIGDRDEPRARGGATAVTIPLDELPDRAPFEVRGDAPVVIDCRVGDLPRCYRAADVLRRLDFDEVALVLPER